jgi:hypothetical protein
VVQDGYRWLILVKMLMIFRVSVNFDKFLTSCATISFSRTIQFHAVTLLSYLQDYTYKACSTHGSDKECRQDSDSKT